MRVGILFTAITLATITAASAHTRHHHYRHHYRYHHRASIEESDPFTPGTIGSCNTEAGNVVVAYSLCGRFQSLIADFVAHGYRPRHMGGYARSGHVHNSRHYAGAAIDFDQTGWGRTVGFMYRAHSIIVAHGLRDGCDFRDCGHVDDGVSIGTRRYARRSERRRYASR